MFLTVLHLYVSGTSTFQVLTLCTKSEEDMMMDIASTTTLLPGMITDFSVQFQFKETKLDKHIYDALLCLDLS